MKQILPFVKDISFQTKINEITSIALEHNLKMENDNSNINNNNHIKINPLCGIKFKLNTSYFTN